MQLYCVVIRIGATRGSVGVCLNQMTQIIMIIAPAGAAFKFHWQAGKKDATSSSSLVRPTGLQGYYYYYGDQGSIL